MLFHVIVYLMILTFFNNEDESKPGTF